MLEKIKNDLLNKFVEMRAKPGYLIDLEWLNFYYRESFHPQDQFYIDQAVEELVEEGIVELKNRIKGMDPALTEKGYKELFSKFELNA